MFLVVFWEIFEGDPSVSIRVVDAFSEDSAILGDVLGEASHNGGVYDVQVHDGGIGLFDGSDQVHVPQGPLDVGLVVAPAVESSQVGVLVQQFGVKAGV